jgi:hypothetical protein
MHIRVANRAFILKEFDFGHFQIRHKQLSNPTQQMIRNGKGDASKSAPKQGGTQMESGMGHRARPAHPR